MSIDKVGGTGGGLPPENRPKTKRSGRLEGRQVVRLAKPKPGDSNKEAQIEFVAKKKIAPGTKFEDPKATDPQKKTSPSKRKLRKRLISEQKKLKKQIKKSQKEGREPNELLKLTRAWKGNLHTCPLQFASEKQKGSPFIMPDVLDINQEAFQFASDELKNDKSFYREYISEYPNMLKHAPSKIKENKAFIKELRGIVKDKKDLALLGKFDAIVELSIKSTKFSSAENLSEEAKNPSARMKNIFDQNIEQA